MELTRTKNNNIHKRKKRTNRTGMCVLCGQCSNFTVGSFNVYDYDAWVEFWCAA